MDEFVANVMSASLSQTHAITEMVISNLTEQAEQATAELAAVRDRVEALLCGPYMPTPDAIRTALYPGWAD